MQRHAFLSAQSWLSLVEDSKVLGVLASRQAETTSNEPMEKTRLFKGTSTLFTNAGRLALTSASKEQFLYFSPHVPGSSEPKDPTELDLELVVLGQPRSNDGASLYANFDGKWYLMDHFQIEKICKRLAPKDNKPPYCEFEFPFVGLRFFLKDVSLQDAQKVLKDAVKEMLSKLKANETPKSPSIEPSSKRRKVASFGRMMFAKKNEAAPKEPVNETEVEKAKDDLRSLYASQVAFLSITSKLSSPLTTSNDSLGDQLNNMVTQYTSGILKPQDRQRMEDLVNRKLLEAETLLEAKFNEAFMSTATNNNGTNNTNNNTNNNNSTTSNNGVDSTTKEPDLKKGLSVFEFQEAKKAVIDAIETKLVLDLMSCK